MYQDGQASAQMPGDGRKRRSVRYQQDVPDRVTDAAGFAYPDRRRRTPAQPAYGMYADIADQSYDTAAYPQEAAQDRHEAARSPDAPPAQKKNRPVRQASPAVAAESVVTLKKTLAEKRVRIQSTPEKQKTSAAGKKSAAAAAKAEVRLTQNGFYLPPPPDEKKGGNKAGGKKAKTAGNNSAPKPAAITSMLDKAKGKLSAAVQTAAGRQAAPISSGKVPPSSGYAYAGVGQLPQAQHKPPDPSAQPPVFHGQQGNRPGYASPPPSPPANGSGRRGTPPSSHRFWVAALTVLLAAALLTAGFFMIRSAVLKKQLEDYVTPYNETFVPGVYVDGISLAGMTPDAAMAAVQAQISSRNDAWRVRLTYQGSEVVVITAAMLNMQVDVETVLREAWAQGHTGTMLERRAAMEQLAVTPYHAYTATPSGDTSRIDDTLQQIQDAVYQQPQDARMVLFDPNSKDPFQFQAEVAGRRLDIAPLKERLYQMVSAMESGDVEIQPETIEPTVTVAQLKTKYTLLASVYTPIDKSSTENRINNIRRSFQPLNGYILAPTRKLSYNQVVGMRTLENGFYEALEHVYGQLVEGVGGGTCQASTTLYQAAVIAGMEIVKRSAHSLEVTYSERGQDATVYWTRDKEIDLVIRNNTHSDLYFTAAVERDPANKSRLVARVAIYGEPLEPGVTYKMDTTQLKVLEPPAEPRYIKDTKAIYVTYVDQQKTVRNARKGYEVETFRMKYKDGQLVDMTTLGVDTYPARPEEIYVGVTQR